MSGIPTAAAVAADVYKAGVPAGHLWRVGPTVSFSYVPRYSLSVGQDPTTGPWMPTPVCDVLHTSPYEGDHRLQPAVKDHLSDSVARKHRLALGVVDETVSSWLVAVDASTLPMPEKWLRGLRRRIARRLRDVGR